MSLFQQPNSKFWWYSISRGRKLPRLRGSTGKTSKDEAAAVERVMRLAYLGKTSAAKLHSAIDALTGDSHIGLPLPGVWDVYEKWMAGAKRGMADITRRQRRRACERFAEWAIHNWPAVAVAGEVNRSCAAGFAQWLSDKGTSGKTRRNLLADLGTVWEGLKRVRDDITQNPWPLVLPENDSERGSAFSLDQERAIIEEADKAGRGWGLACRIARFTGLRYGDIARLPWSSVDFAGRVIRMSPSKTARHGVSVVLPLSDDLLYSLQASFSVRGSSEFVLTEHAKAYPYPNKGIPGPFSAILLAAKVSGSYTFHSWRHTFRSRLASAGVSDEIAKRLGGWTVDATAMRYDHDGRIEELREAVQRGSAVSKVEVSK